MRKGRWHGAAVTEGSKRLRVSTDRVQKGKILRSLSQPTADSSLYAREPTCDPSVSLRLTAPFAQGSPLIRHAFGVPPSPEGKAASGGGLPSTCYVAYRVFLQGILPQAVTQLWKGAVRKGLSTKKFHSSFTSCGVFFSISQEGQAAGQGKEAIDLRHLVSFRLIFKSIHSHFLVFH